GPVVQEEETPELDAESDADILQANQVQGLEGDAATTPAEEQSQHGNVQASQVQGLEPQGQMQQMQAPQQQAPQQLNQLNVQAPAQLGDMQGGDGPDDEPEDEPPMEPQQQQGPDQAAQNASLQNAGPDMGAQQGGAQQGGPQTAGQSPQMLNQANAIQQAQTPQPTAQPGGPGKAQEIDKVNAQQVGDAKPSDGGVAPEQKMAKIEPKEMELQNGNKVAQQMGGNEKLNELGGKEQLGGGAGADIANVSPTQQP